MDSKEIVDMDFYNNRCTKCGQLFDTKDKRQFTCDGCYKLLEEPSIFASFRKLQDRVESLEKRLNHVEVLEKNHSLNDGISSSRNRGDF